MTRGEITLVAFIFGLVYAAAFIPRLGAFVGRRLFGGASRPADGSRD